VSESNSAFSFKNLSLEQIVAIGMLLGFALYTIWDQFYWWGEREDYSFGYLVPLFAAYVLYDRWPVIQGYLLNGAPSCEAPNAEASGLQQLLEWTAFAIFIGALALFAIGALLRSVTGPQHPASLAIAAGFAGLLLSVVFIMTKERVDGQPISLQGRLMLTGVFLFPALIWLISAPMVSVVEKQIRVFLLTKVTIVVFNIFDVIGYEIEREGNVLLLPMGQVGVEEACSGIRSLTACLFAGSFLAAVFLNRFWKKVLLVVAAMGFAVLTNMIRSLFLTLWAYHYGSEAIDAHWILPLVGDIGSVHDVTGFAILGCTCVGLLLLLPIFNYSLKDFDESSDDATFAGQ
jgi:exosortase